MKRRHFISNAALGTASAAALGACNQGTTGPGIQANTFPNVQWKMVTSWPTSLDTIYGGATTVCDRVKEMTGGRFTIKPYAAGEIVPGLQVLDTVQNGTVECGAAQQNAWLYHGGGLEAMHKIYSDFNIINFPAGNSGAQMGGWFKREIQTLQDLQGLKMRIPGTGGEVMSRLGVNVQVLPGGEIYLALDRGAIDAAEWVGPYDDEKLGLNKAAKFYYYPGWWEPGPTLDLLVNKSAWDKLPQEYQAILQSAAKDANINMLAQYNALNPPALKRMLAEGTKLIPYSAEILRAAQKASFELYEEKASDDDTFKEVYEGWNKFREGIQAWNNINELSFSDFVASNS